MANINLQVNEAVALKNGESKTGIVLSLKITAADLTPVDHDIIGYNGSAYISDAARLAGAEAIRLESIHQEAGAGPRGINFNFGGRVLSTAFTYDVGIINNKSELTVASQTSLVTYLIGVLATQLGVDPANIAVL